MKLVLFVCATSYAFADVIMYQSIHNEIATAWVKCPCDERTMCVLAYWALMQI